jgi:geranylgeranyl diphosphate synthase type II
MGDRSDLAVGRSQIDSIRHRVDTRLAELSPAGPPSEAFSRVIRYSLLAPGKRLRPVLTVLTSVSLGGSEQHALDPACAMEMIHTASLIIDDLPAMDNATHRRGRLANHKEFGEDKAILAGFALVNQAFDVMSRAEHLGGDLQLSLVRLAARAIGLNGIIAGQQRDLDAEAGLIPDASTDSVQQTYNLKTSALFVAAAEAGARVAGLTGRELQPIRRFAQNLGLAYQTRDDLIDRHGSMEDEGKNTRADADKITLLSLMGEADAASLNRGFIDAAIRALQPYGEAAQPLVDMSRIIFEDSVSPQDGRTSTH